MIETALIEEENDCAQAERENLQNGDGGDDLVSSTNSMSDLKMPEWAVIDSESCIVCGVTYQEAVDLGISFFNESHTIVTKDTAHRLFSAGKLGKYDLTKVDDCSL